MTLTTLSPDQPAVAADPVSQSQDSEWPGLATAAANIGVPLTPEIQDQLAVYLRLLIERSAQFNLTAIREPLAMERRLFLDAIAMVPALDRARTGLIGSTARLIDIGSGAGFPGLVLKIVRPELGVTLVDATGKKVRFLLEVIQATALEEIHAIHGRAEELARRPEYRERFNLATARAVASLPVLLELTTPFLDVGGKALLPKGLDLSTEVGPGKHAAKLLGCRIDSTALLPTRDSRLVVVEKRTLTPGKYPRPTGVPNQTPLGTAR